jgi:putative zinc finger protein
MTEVPKIVYDRLRAARLQQLPIGSAAESVHPDSNLLTAFAEQVLSATEHDSVLEHLALCAECRDTVALALPAENVEVISVFSEPVFSEGEKGEAPIPRAAEYAASRLFAWPRLRWVALAACAAVVGSALLLRPGKLNPPTQPSAGQQIASTAAPTSTGGSPSGASSPSIVSSIVSSGSNYSSGRPSGRQAGDHPELSANRDETASITDGPLSKDATARRTLPSPAQAESAMALARRKKSSEQADKRTNIPGMLALDGSASQETAGGTADETIEVSAAGEVAPSAADTASTARNFAPAIEKAKPALPNTAQENGLPASAADQVHGVNGAPAPRLQARAMSPAAAKAITPGQTSGAGLAPRDFAWTINSGVLRRSLDNGQTWQDSLRADHPLLCYASHSDEIWTGGQGGTLYHSTDGGISWVRVYPSANGRQLSADVSQIEVRNSNLGDFHLGSKNSQAPTKIVLSTNNKQVWTSVDGGKSWETK